MAISIRRRLRAIAKRLERVYGEPPAPRHLPPIDELVLTILSQNTSDLNSDRAYRALRKRFRSWRGVATAPTSEVADAIRPGGLAQQKAPRIQAVLRAIEERVGSIDLEWLRDLSDDEVREYLRSLPGVGPKTAACVLAFSLDRAAIPVDTHVFRTATRLGWLPPGATAESAHVTLHELVPARLRVSMHVGLIRLGREICRPGRPQCEECPLAKLCPTAPLILGADEETRGGPKRQGRPRVRRER